MEIKPNIIILVIAVIVLATLNYKPEPQAIAPSCFDKEECKVSIQQGYCDVVYDCISGKCYHEFTLCPEQCYGGEDEDKDNLIDCDDTDCFSSEYCGCESADYNDCAIGRCYCPDNKLPRWVILDEAKWCQCL